MATLAEVLRQAGYVTPQGQVVGPRTTTAQTMSNYIRNIIPNAAQNLAQQRSDIDAALTMGDQGIQVGDRAAFERQMAQVPNLMGLTAYHGTPHTIKGKFDINKVGAGEGAQAYGHGMYFAEAPSVAETYKTKLSGGLGSPSNELLINGQPLQNLTDAQRRAYEIVARDGRKNALGTAKDLEAQGFDASHIREALAATKGKEINLVKNEGNLYKVDIPDEYIPNMLDWDKPLKEQPNIVEMLKTSKNKDIQKMIANLDSFANSNTPPTGQNLLKTLGYYPDNPKKASKILDSLGIKGVRYLDEGSREAKKGTSNFVVFDPAEVKILEQNSKPLSRKEILEQELKKVVE
jgi:uncharacterized membrane protein